MDHLLYDKNINTKTTRETAVKWIVSQLQDVFFITIHQFGYHSTLWCNGASIYKQFQSFCKQHQLQFCSTWKDLLGFRRLNCCHKRDTAFTTKFLKGWSRKALGSMTSAIQPSWHLSCLMYSFNFQEKLLSYSCDNLQSKSFLGSFSKFWSLAWI